VPLFSVNLHRKYNWRTLARGTNNPRSLCIYCRSDNKRQM